MLANNSSVNDGGGLFAYIGSNPILANVTIVNNSSGGVGGIYNFNTIDMTIKNSIISGNSSTQIKISNQPQIQNSALSATKLKLKTFEFAIFFVWI